MTQIDAKPRGSERRDGDGAERAWGAFVIAWVTVGIAAVGGWLASLLMRAFEHDDDE